MFLTDNGFTPEGNNFPTSVSTALKRLTTKSKVETELRSDGQRVYWIKPA